MRVLLTILLGGASLLLVGALYLLQQLHFSSGDTFRMAAKLRSDSISHSQDPAARYQKLRLEALKRAELYEFFIQQDHLYMGMIVNRDQSGAPLSECDSLLFSSLRFVALEKMGMHNEAEHTWESIITAVDNGKWHRHPKCRARWTSRDMIVGVLAALSQHPSQGEGYLRDLIAYVEQTGGYIGSGPFYVSRLTPGLAQMIRILSEEYGLSKDELPNNIRFGFSTVEFNTVTPSRGYTAHLSAMNIWLEIELRERRKKSSSIVKVRTVTELIDQLLYPVSSYSMEDQRLQWVSNRLVALDPDNLFFKWLQLKSANALTVKSKGDLLEELLSMEQFPQERLPQNCDRKADYLWQRDSLEYDMQFKTCTEEFSGVDFLWMVSLLI